MDKKIYSFAMRGIAALLIFVFLLAFFKYFLPVLLPFMLAYLISAGIRPISRLLSEKTKVSKKAAAIVLIVLFALILCGALWFVGSTLVREIREVLSAPERLLEGSAVRKISDKMTVILDKARVFDIDISKMQSTAVSRTASALAGFVGGIVKGAPSFLFFLVVTILSLFYFSCDMEGIRNELSRVLSKGAMDALSSWSGICLGAVGRFARAYLSLFGITLAVVTLGFFLIGIKYPFLGALLCAFVDLLPVFGVGSVLFPWAVFLFLTGETTKAVGMLILLFVMYALRQILEPKIVGGAAGVHPVTVLFGVFLGFKLLGVGGMIAAPLVLNGVAVFMEEKRKKLEPKVDKTD